MYSSGDLSSYCIQLFQAIHSMNSSDINGLILNDHIFDTTSGIKPFISYGRLSSDSIEFLNNVYFKIKSGSN